MPPPRRKVKRESVFSFGRKEKGASAPFVLARIFEQFFEVDPIRIVQREVVNGAISVLRIRPGCGAHGQVDRPVGLRGLRADVFHEDDDVAAVVVDERIMAFEHPDLMDAGDVPTRSQARGDLLEDQTVQFSEIVADVDARDGHEVVIEELAELVRNVVFAAFRARLGSQSIVVHSRSSPSFFFPFALVTEFLAALNPKMT